MLNKLIDNYSKISKKNSNKRRMFWFLNRYHLKTSTQVCISVNTYCSKYEGEEI